MYKLRWIIKFKISTKKKKKKRCGGSSKDEKEQSKNRKSIKTKKAEIKKIHFWVKKSP